jgi:hypothetical protein
VIEHGDRWCSSLNRLRPYESMGTDWRRDIVKIGKTLGVGTGTVQRVVTEQPRPFDAEAYAFQ